MESGRKTTRKVNPGNFRAYAARLAEDYEAEKRRAKDEYALCFTARQVGNIYWEFGDFMEARRWFLAEVALLRNIDRGRHSDAVAFAQWKAGNLGDMREECHAIVDQRVRHVGELERRSTRTAEDERLLALGFLDLGMATLLLGDYGDALSWSERVLAASGDKPHREFAVREFGAALKEDSRDRFVDGLRFLRGLQFRWPTFDSTGNADLYRYALSLSRERFGGIPEDLAAEFLSPDGGESVDFVAILREAKNE